MSSKQTFEVAVVVGALAGEILGETVGCGLGWDVFAILEENLESVIGELVAVPLEVAGPLDGIPVGEALGDGLGCMLVAPKLVSTVAVGPTLGVAVGEWFE